MNFKDEIIDSLSLSDFSDYEGTISRAIKRFLTLLLAGGSCFLLTGLAAGFTNPISLVFLAIPLSATVWSGFDIIYSSVMKANNDINNKLSGGADVVKYEKIAQMERFDNKLKPRFVSGLEKGLYVNIEEVCSCSGSKHTNFSTLVKKLAKEQISKSDVLIEYKGKLWLEPKFINPAIK